MSFRGKKLSNELAIVDEPGRREALLTGTACRPPL